MIPSVARQIMRLVATFSITGPIVVGYAMAQRIIAFEGTTPVGERYLIYSALLSAFGVAVYSWFKFTRILYRYERPDLMRDALFPAGSLLFVFPLLVSSSGYFICLIWPPFWGMVLNLISTLLTAIESSVREALEHDAD